MTQTVVRTVVKRRPLRRPAVPTPMSRGSRGETRTLDLTIMSRERAGPGTSRIVRARFAARHNSVETSRRVRANPSALASVTASNRCVRAIASQVACSIDAPSKLIANPRGPGEGSRKAESFFTIGVRARPLPESAIHGASPSFYSRIPDRIASGAQRAVWRSVGVCWAHCDLPREEDLAAGMQGPIVPSGTAAPGAQGEWQGRLVLGK